MNRDSYVLTEADLIDIVHNVHPEEIWKLLHTDIDITLNRCNLSCNTHMTVEWFNVFKGSNCEVVHRFENAWNFNAMSRRMNVSEILKRPNLPWVVDEIARNRTITHEHIDELKEVWPDRSDLWASMDERDDSDITADEVLSLSRQDGDFTISRAVGVMRPEELLKLLDHITIDEGIYYGIMSNTWGISPEILSRVRCSDIPCTHYAMTASLNIDDLLLSSNTLDISRVCHNPTLRAEHIYNLDGLDLQDMSYLVFSSIVSMDEVRSNPNFPWDMTGLCVNPNIEPDVLLMLSSRFSNIARRETCLASMHPDRIISARVDYPDLLPVAPPMLFMVLLNVRITMDHLKQLKLTTSLLNKAKVLLPQIIERAPCDVLEEIYGLTPGDERILCNPSVTWDIICKLGLTEQYINMLSSDNVSQLSVNDIIQVVREGRLVPQMISRNFNLTQQDRLFLSLGCYRSFLRTYEPEVNICMRLSDVDITCVT
jgi:hypothetical protein